MVRLAAGRRPARVCDPPLNTRRIPMTVTAQEREQQLKQAEEILFSGPQKLGFANGLFFGQFNAAQINPYPELNPDERDIVAKAVSDVRRFAEEKIDAAAVDRNAEIPSAVIAGLR